MTKATSVPIEKIHVDHKFQIRVAIRTETVNEYAEAYAQNSKLPPLDVFKNGDGFLLADGFHRIAAAKQSGLKSVDVIIHFGGPDSIIKLAIAANSRHGQRLTNEDKRKIVGIALEQWPKLSSRAIAEICAVDHKFVDKIRNEVATVASSISATYSESTERPKNGTRVGRDGKSHPAKPKEEINEPEVLLDSKGYPVPLNIKEEWLRADALASAQMKLCSDMKSLLNTAEQSKDRIFNEINISEALADISDARFKWKMVKPFAVCTNCEGKVPKTCEFCGEKGKGNGKGWISEFRYRTVLPELIAMREKSTPTMIQQVRKEMMAQ